MRMNIQNTQMIRSDIKNILENLNYTEAIPGFRYYFESPKYTNTTGIRALETKSKYFIEYTYMNSSKQVINAGYGLKSKS